MAFGVPAPQGSKRHVGNGRMIEASQKLVPWRNAVKAATIAQLGPDFTPIETPVALDITFSVARPKTVKIAYPITRYYGDIDKLARSTLDALTFGGLLIDDSIVVDLRARKVFVGTSDDDSLLEPGAVIRARSL